MSVVEEFKFDRKSLLLFFVITIILIIGLNYSVLLSYKINLSGIIIGNIVIIGFICFWFFFESFSLWNDIIITRAVIIQIYFTWHFFKFPKKIRIQFKDVYLIKHIKGPLPAFNYVQLFTKKASIKIFYSQINHFPKLVKLLLSKAPRNCEIIGFERNKERKLLW